MNLKSSVIGGIVAAAAVVAAVAVAGEKTVLEAILVRVNDRIVTVSEFEQRLQQELAQLPELPEGDEMVEFRERMLDNVVNELILLERADEKGIVPDEGAIDEAIQGLREANELQDDALFQAALAETGMTVESLRERYRDSFMIQRAAQGEVKPTEITREELRRIYEKERENFAVPAMVELQQMIFPIASDRSDLEAVGTRVIAMLERVDAGADLKAEATLAGVELQELGAIPVQDLRPELVEILAPLDEGDFSQPAATAAGIQVLRLVRRIPAGYQSFDEVEGDIRRRETERVFFEQRRGFIDRLKENYLIEIHAERLPEVAHE